MNENKHIKGEHRSLGVLVVLVVLLVCFAGLSGLCVVTGIDFIRHPIGENAQMGGVFFTLVGVPGFIISLVGLISVGRRALTQSKSGLPPAFLKR